MIAKITALLCFLGLARAGYLGGALGYSGLGYGEGLGYGSLGYSSLGYSGLGYSGLTPAYSTYAAAPVIKTIAAAPIAAPIIKTVAPISYAAPAISSVSFHSAPIVKTIAPAASYSYAPALSYGYGGYGKYAW